MSNLLFDTSLFPGFVGRNFGWCCLLLLVAWILTIHSKQLIVSYVASYIFLIDDNKEYSRSTGQHKDENGYELGQVLPLLLLPLLLLCIAGNRKYIKLKLKLLLLFFFFLPLLSYLAQMQDKTNYTFIRSMCTVMGLGMDGRTTQLG